MSENTTTPDPSTPTQPYTPAAEPAAEKPAKRRGRTALIAGGAALGALVLVGGGVAIGSALDDDDRLDGVAVSQQGEADGTRDTAAGTQGGVDGTRVDDTDDDAPDVDDDTAATTASGEFGASDAAELDGIAKAAQGVADGEPTAIDANRDGSWDVTLTGADGSETEVLVGADGQAVVRETEGPDADDRAPQNVLDTATLQAMVDAALAEQPGRIIDVDADDDNRSPFDVSILTGDRQIVEVTLDASGTVLKTELDD
ncbi:MULTISPECIES: PepSY domain-containing protein [unclassified Microbacterium]|uniref:PepSY domain-containing protein n=1 Tax=unclassified Microbacterium TaxID=2609290 RepID=UPI003C2E20DD